MNLSRRNLLKWGMGTAAMCATGIHPLGAMAMGKKKIPVGLQLYSVRHDCAKDLPGVLKAVGKMGYDAVEFAGYHGRTAAELRKMLDENGLKCCGTHTHLDTLLGDALKKTIEFNKTIGNKYLIVPWLPEDKRNSVKAAKETAKLFTELAAKVKSSGMRVGYHAHAGDFEKIDNGGTAWDVLFSTAGPDVIMQLDTCNCMQGGGDPVAILKKFPGRSATVHLKEYGGKKGAVLGEGEVPWEKVFKICETTGGTKWYVIEHEAHSASPLDAVNQCLKNFRKMGK